MNKKYLAPQATISRLLAANITTVSTEADWGDGWDENLDDTTEASDQVDA